MGSRRGGAARPPPETLGPRRPPQSEGCILFPMPDEAPKRLIVVGDRVLLAPEEGEERTNEGLYLPATALEGRQVQGGRITTPGPGTPITAPAGHAHRRWNTHG